MAERIELDGYSFDNDMGLEAQKEEKAIDYVTKQLDMNKPETVLKVYRQIISQKLFHTMVGYNFLKGLQNYLMSNPEMKGEDIAPIEIDSVEESMAAINASRKKRGQSIITTVVTAPGEDAAASGTKGAKEDGKYKNKSRLFMATTMILAGCVVAMFAITLTAKVPTILNYRTMLNNQYATWEQELNEREDAIREREAALNQMIPTEESTQESTEENTQRSQPQPDEEEETEE